jgi:hypothetical protein
VRYGTQGKGIATRSARAVVAVEAARVVAVVAAPVVAVVAVAPVVEQLPPAAAGTDNRSRGADRADRRETAHSPDTAGMAGMADRAVGPLPLTIPFVTGVVRPDKRPRGRRVASPKYVPASAEEGRWGR